MCDLTEIMNKYQPIWPAIYTGILSKCPHTFFEIKFKCTSNKTELISIYGINGWTNLCECNPEKGYYHETNPFIE